MPCSECRTVGHTRPKCPQYAMDRALSIINDGIDLAPYNGQPDGAEWFKQGDLMPMQLGWYPNNTGLTNINRTAIQVLSQLQWLRPRRFRISTPTCATEETKRFARLECIVAPKADRWYSYTYDLQAKRLIETLIPEPEAIVNQLDLIVVPTSVACMVEVGEPPMPLYGPLYYTPEKRVQFIKCLISGRVKLVDSLRRDRLTIERRRVQQERYEREREAWRAGRAGRQQQEQQNRADHARLREEREVRALELYQKKLDELPTVKDKAISCDDCPICLDPFGPTNFCVLRCGHKTCGDCAFQHFQRAGGTSCPTCRQDYAVRLPGWIPPQIA